MRTAPTQGQASPSAHVGIKGLKYFYNVFSCRHEGGLSNTFARYLGGLQKYIAITMGLLAPTSILTCN